MQYFDEVIHDKYRIFMISKINLFLMASTKFKPEIYFYVWLNCVMTAALKEVENSLHGGGFSAVL